MLGINAHHREGMCDSPLEAIPASLRDFALRAQPNATGIRLVDLGVVTYQSRTIEKKTGAWPVCFILAERVGFEPTVLHNSTPDFESGAIDHSTTSPAAALSRRPNYSVSKSFRRASHTFDCSIGLQCRTPQIVTWSSRCAAPYYSWPAILRSCWTKQHMEHG